MAEMYKLLIIFQISQPVLLKTPFSRERELYISPYREFHKYNLSTLSCLYKRWLEGDIFQCIDCKSKRLSGKYREFINGVAVKFLSAIKRLAKV